MELKELQRNWNAFGEIDPLGAILTEPTKIRGGWDEREFFQRGVDEIAAVMRYVETIRPDLLRGAALDFGCGVGRLTQALARDFERSCGVDIAPSMIRLANHYNQHGQRCQYFLNERDDLALFEDDRFDFIFSTIVLQHMRPEYAMNYIKEFIRVLAPGGLIVFQLPSVPCDRDRSTAKPLPASGFRSRVVPLDPPSTLRPGARATFRVLVKNESDAIWPSRWDHEGRYQVRLGNHWYDRNGNQCVVDDGRTDLAADLMPGEEVELPLTVTAPRSPGRYTLEAEMVQEELTWFQARGATPARHTVRVKHTLRRRLSEVYRKVTTLGHPEHGRSLVAPDAEEIRPVMEMYGIERSRVEALIAANGGRVLDVRTSECPYWVHGHYCVTK